jgi:hypothetical protein
MTRRRSRRFALLTLLGLLFAQFALAAYACQWTAVDGNADAARVEMPVGCDGMDGNAAGSAGILCVHHCKAESGPVETGSAAAQGAAAMTLLPFVLRVDPGNPGRAPPPPQLAAAAGPRLLALHARLRI